jgi:hypothetical protein
MSVATILVLTATNTVICWMLDMTFESAADRQWIKDAAANGIGLAILARFFPFGG